MSTQISQKKLFFPNFTEEASAKEEDIQEESSKEASTKEENYKEEDLEEGQSQKEEVKYPWMRPC